ncbi:MAG: hypothetical protein ACTSU4_01970 [Promethearchaeota archaeon]
MKSSKRLLLNVILLIIMFIGFLLVIPWMNMWIRFTASGAPDLTWIADLQTIILYRNLFLLGGVMIASALVVMIIVNFFIVFIQSIE